MGSHAPKAPPSGKQIELEKGSLWGKLGIIGAALGVVGLGGWFGLKGTDEGHAWSALLTAYFFAWALSLGGLFFVVCSRVRKKSKPTIRLYRRA